MNRAFVSYASPGEPIVVAVYEPDGTCHRAMVGPLAAWRLGQQLIDAAGREFTQGHTPRTPNELRRRLGLPPLPAMARLGPPSWPCNRCRGDASPTAAELDASAMPEALFRFIVLGRSDW